MEATQHETVFIESCQEHLDLMEQAILDLEEGGDPARLLADIMRSAHTIKGDAMGFGRKQLGELAHQLEETILAMLLVKSPASNASIDALLAAVDRIRNAL